MVTHRRPAHAELILHHVCELARRRLAPGQQVDEIPPDRMRHRLKRVHSRVVPWQASPGVAPQFWSHAFMVARPSPRRSVSPQLSSTGPLPARCGGSRPSPRPPPPLSFPRPRCHSHRIRRDSNQPLLPRLRRRSNSTRREMALPHTSLSSSHVEFDVTRTRPLPMVHSSQEIEFDATRSRQPCRRDALRKTSNSMRREMTEDSSAGPLRIASNSMRLITR